MSTDVFGQNQQSIEAPITADNGILNWGGIVTDATNISIGVAQPITRRRTIGNQKAVIYAGQPAGSINIARLLTDDATTLFSRPGWNVCNPGSITVSFGSCDGGAGISVLASGCVVSQYSLAGEAEGKTVIDSVTIEFLQLSLA
jgi:hypothetical protein